MSDVINIYNDLSTGHLDGFGIDISTQRADDLDNKLLELIKENEDNALNILDLGCGKGGQTVRMAALGCEVTAVDVQDLGADIYEACERLSVPKNRITFIGHDIRNTGTYLKSHYNYIYSQRTLHYLCYDDAVVLLNTVREYLVNGFPSKLFLSVSGLHSELGNGYTGKNINIASRFCPLSDEIGEKHKIHLPVCLYTLEELAALLTACGYKVEKIYASPFGNIKAIAGV